MIRLTFHAVCLTAFLALLAACERDDSAPSPPDPFPDAETVVPETLCRRSPDVFLGPSPEDLGAPPPIVEPPSRPRLPGEATADDLEDPVPGAIDNGELEDVPQLADFPPLPEGPPGTATFYWAGLTPCRSILPGSFVPLDVAGATGMVAVQTAPGADALQLLIQVRGLPAFSVASGEGAFYQPWLAARAADGRYLFTALAPFQITDATGLIVRLVRDPLLDDAGLPGIPVEITTDGLRAGTPVTDTALAFPLLYYRHWFITAVADAGGSLGEQPSIVLSGEAKFPVPQLRTAP